MQPLEHIRNLAVMLLSISLANALGVATIDTLLPHQLSIIKLWGSAFDWQRQRENFKLTELLCNNLG
jgi:hypothetical protein